MKEQNQKDYEKFVAEQFRILKGHFDRCMLRCFNHYHKLEEEEDHKT